MRKVLTAESTNRISENDFACKSIFGKRSNRRLGQDALNLRKAADKRSSCDVRMWRNWQTRRFQVPVGDHMGSSPFIRTKQKKHHHSAVFFCLYAYSIRDLNGQVVAA